MFAEGFRTLAPAPMLCPMFIRRTRTRTGERGEVYYSHRLVRSERSGEKVRQRTLLNLGSDFPVERRHWAVLCSRIQQLLDRQAELVPLSCPEEVERHAQAHRRAAAQQRAVRRDRAPRPADGGCRLAGADPPAFGRRRACRAVGHGEARPGGFAGAAGLQRHAARARHGHRDRPHGGAGLGARQLALAVRAFGARRAAGGGFRAHEHDAPLPRLRCPGGAARGDRGAAVRSGDGSVRAALHGDALRPDQHLLRGRGGGPEQGPTRPLQGEALGLPAPDPGAGARRLGLRAPLRGVLRRGQRRQDPGVDARGPGRAGGRAGGDGRGDRHRGQHRLAARERLPLSGGQPGTHPPLRSRSGAGHRDPVAPDGPCAQGGRRRRWRGAALLLLRGAGEEGTGHRKPLRRALRGRDEQAQRRPQAAAHPQEARPCLAADRLDQGEEPRRRGPLRYRRHRRRQRREGAGRHLGAPPARRHHDHPSRRLLPAHQRPGLGPGDAVAHLHFAHRCRGRVPLAQVGTRPAPHLPPHPGALRRPSVHHRDRLPDGADHPPTPRREG